MDIALVIAVLPTCTTWRDIALAARANTNPRTIEPEGTSGYRFRDSVYTSEVNAYFDSLDLDSGWDVTRRLRDLGFLKQVWETREFRTTVLQFQL